MAAKKTTLNELGEMLAHVVKHMATKEDLAEVKRDLKGDVLALRAQVGSIETQLRAMKFGTLEGLVEDLEEKVFGAPRR